MVRPGCPLGSTIGVPASPPATTVVLTRIRSFEERMHCAPGGASMFERFTDRARRVVVLAQEEARMLNHNVIGTEHILLGLIHEGEGVAAKALESLGISLEAARVQLGQLIGPGRRASCGHIPFTARATKVLELSLREARRGGHDAVGPEHILLALIREGAGTGARMLLELGAEADVVRRHVTRLQPEREAREAVRADAEAPSTPPGPDPPG